MGSKGNTVAPPIKCEGGRNPWLPPQLSADRRASSWPLKGHATARARVGRQARSHDPRARRPAVAAQPVSRAGWPGQEVFVTAFRSFSSHVLALAGLLVLSPAAWADPTQYPLTIRNCGVDITFDKAPQRAVAIGQSSTEILLSLGLADKIVGTAVWFGPVLPGYRGGERQDPAPGRQRSQLRIRGRQGAGAGDGPVRMACRAAGLGRHPRAVRRPRHPDLHLAGRLRRQGQFRRRRRRAQAAVQRWTCVYQEIRDLAQIFDVADRGEALVADLQQREAAAIASVAGARLDNVPMVFWFSSKEVAGEAFIAGKNGVPAYILQTARRPQHHHHRGGVAAGELGDASPPPTRRSS